MPLTLWQLACIRSHPRPPPALVGRVKDVLVGERLEILRSGCDKVIRHMLAWDDDPQRPRVGNRGSHRYSFGGAPAHFGCQYEWSMMIDPPVLDAVLTAIFKSDKYILGSGLTSGGDFNIPGAQIVMDATLPRSRFCPLPLTLQLHALHSIFF